MFRPAPRAVVRPDADSVTYRPLEPLDERLEDWRTVIEDPRQLAIYDQAGDRVDRDAYARLQDKYRDEVLSQPERHFTKYLDLAPWFMIHSRIAVLLDIDRRPPSSILDVGAGGGQFAAIAKAFGHDVTALDLAEPEIYGDLLALFGIRRIEAGVYYLKPLPAAVGRYDLIVIHGQQFDVHPKSRKRWGVPEWTGLIDYLTTHHLKYPGNLFIGLNRSVPDGDRLDYLWPLIEIAGKHGAVQHESRASIHHSVDGPVRYAEVDYDRWPAPDGKPPS